MSDNYAKIKGFVQKAYQRPASKDTKYFAFEEGERFMVNGSKLRALPNEHTYLYAKDEFWVRIDVEKREAIYYAYDIQDYRHGTHVNTVQGIFDWNKIESSVYQFFIQEITYLTNDAFPYSDLRQDRMIETGTASRHQTDMMSRYGSNGSHNGTHSRQEFGPHGRQEFGPQHSSFNDDKFASKPSAHTNYYGSSSFKERDAFFDKIYACVREGKTSVAIDAINEQFAKMAGENRFDDIDAMLRFISMDKLNIPAMIEVLSGTLNVCDKLKERKDIYGKAKTHINRCKNGNSEVLLKGLETL